MGCLVCVCEFPPGVKDAYEETLHCKKAYLLLFPCRFVFHKPPTAAGLRWQEGRTAGRYFHEKFVCGR